MTDEREETELVGREISDDMLEFVAAAGGAFIDPLGTP